MSCNGCRVLRKGCSDNCMLRHCLQWIDSPQAQSHATVFVAKFFGRAGLMTFISSVAEDQRPALFQSLLYEAVGRTVNPVNGAVGLLWAGNWQVCQSGVETVLNGGALGPLAESPGRGGPVPHGVDYNASAAVRFVGRQRSGPRPKRKPASDEEEEEDEEEEDGCSVSPDLNLRLVPKRRASSEENYSETTTLGSSSSADNLESSNNFAGSDSRKILRLFI